MKYSIYLARIEGAASAEDSRIQVRVLPDMEDMERDVLPMWPHFFRNESITGKPGALVWVLSNEEYTTGYILGYANFFSWRDEYEEASIPAELYEVLDNANIELQGKIMNYSDIQVTFWNENTLHFIERSTGASIIAYRSGTIYTVSPGLVDVTVGNSIFRITPEEIILSAANIRIEGEIKLGTNPQGKVFVSGGTGGGNSVPSRDVWA